jgi:NDP-sugar pyrophosphorylase family protein
VLVVSGDMLFNPDSFDLDAILEFFDKQDGDLACHYEVGAGAWITFQTICTRSLRQHGTADKESTVDATR